MWDIKFDPFYNKETVGNLSVTNGTFNYTSSVNLDDDNSINGFISDVESKINDNKIEVDYDIKLNSIITKLNKLNIN